MAFSQLKTKTLQRLITFVLMLFVLGTSAVVFAQETEPVDDETDLVNEKYEEEKLNIIDEQEDLLQSLKKRLRHSVRELSDIQDSISEFHFGIAEQEERIDSLEEQVINIDDQVARTEDKVVNVTRQIEIKELQIGELFEQLDVKNLQIEEQSEILSAYLTFLYFQDATFYDNRSREFNIFKLILDDNTFSENISEIKFLNLFQKQGTIIFENLIELEDGLLLEQDNLAINRRSLKLLRQSLRDEQVNLQALKEGKKRLMAETQGKQEVFEKLAAKERAQEEQIATEISMLTLNIHAFDTALAKIRAAGNEEEIAEAVRIRDDLLDLKERAFTYNLGDSVTGLNWPVSPYRGITAYFKDSGYVSRFGVNHGAVDIRAPQNSPIFAPADGVVFKVIGKGSDDLGYHYVIVTHRNGIQTLYGHLTKIIVSEGQFVRAGDILALSGGTIGTTGSGTRTTGPHLHFEVHRFGSRVDPLDHLPLSALPLKYVPQEKLALLYEQELESKYGDRGSYEWQKKAEGQSEANKEYLERSEEKDGDSDTIEESEDTSTNLEIPSADDILKNDAFDYLERYEKLREQYEGKTL